MDGVNGTRMDLLAAWRLLNRSQGLDARVKDKKPNAETFNEIPEKDRELLGLDSQPVENQSAASEINIRQSVEDAFFSSTIDKKR